MKKLLISLAVTSALGLTGCGGEKLEDIKADTVAEGTQVPLSRVVFDPTAGRVSVPNDLLFSGTTDGTLAMPGETDSATGKPLDKPNYADPQTALGALDGWSTQNPFSIELAIPGGVTFDAATASRPDAVRLVEVLMGDPTSTDASCRAVPRGVACKAVSQLTFGTDFVTRAVGNSVAVIPLKPLKSATTYILVLTNTLRDSEGRSIAPSSTYELLKQDLTTLPLGSEAQRQLQGVINSFERVVGTQGITKESIIYTAAITTQSTTNVLSTIKGLMLKSPAKPKVQVTDTGLLASQVMFKGVPIPDSTQHPLFFYKLAKLYKGSISLPYYLGDSTSVENNNALSTSWKAACDSGAIIASLTEAQKTALEAGITSPEQVANDKFCKDASNGALRDFGLDKQRHLTKFNAIPKANSLKTLSVQMTVPTANPAYPNLVKPEAGWPVVILQHGITSCKENMLAVTGALSAAGFATVAIDHPLHGSRGYNFTGDDADEVNASGPSCLKNDVKINGKATDYMNLSNLLVTRDNLRQSVADMLGLRLGLNDVGLNGLIDKNNVHFLGHSLGAITGTSMVALANSSLGDASLDAQYKINSTVLAMPGGAVANFLLDSPAFGNLIKASVILGSKTLAPEFQAFIGTSCGSDPATYVACASTKVTPYLTSLTAAGKTATLASIQSTLSQFAFAAQTATEAGDPNNYAAALVASNAKVHMIEVVGTGTSNDKVSLPDQVIPNSSANMPLAGTEPLVKLLGAATVPAQAGNWQVTRASIARFIFGDHSSILAPDKTNVDIDSVIKSDVTAEMQTQSASFFMQNGAAVSVSKSSVLKTQ